MKQFVAFVCVLFALAAQAQSRLPNCQGSHLTVVWQDCFGVITQPNGDKLIGEFKNGRLDGQGMETAANGHRYVGYFKNGLPDGQGAETFPEGHKFEGEFREGRYQGQGRFTFATGNSFEGSFHNGKPHGHGTYRFSSGDQYVGSFQEGKRSGRGTFSYADGRRYLGEFSEGDFNGLGVELRADGSLARSGRWKDGQLAESFAIDPARFALEQQAQTLTFGAAAPQRVAPSRQEPASQTLAIATPSAALSAAPSAALNATPSAAPERAAASAAAPAQRGGRRLALVLGNDSYKSAQPLQNARADARAMANSLSAAGFKVLLRLDLNLRDTNDALRNFIADVQSGDEVVFFYAGHGVQVGAGNYLLPVDVRNQSENQVKDDAIPLQRILEDLGDRKARFSLAIIDACRDNPFKSMGRSIGGRGLTATAAAAAGQMVVFSAGAGQQALDRLGDKDKNPNGLFTRVFLSEMTVPNRSIDQVVRSVRNRVVEMAKSVGHEQTPALYDQSIGEFVFVRK